MATNTPPTQQPPAQEVILVRGSAEHKEYLRQFGWLRNLVNGLEDGLAISGRSLLLIFILYTTVKAGLTLSGHDVPWWIDTIALGFQVCGLEGAIPGLSRLRETLLAKNQPAASQDAETVKKAIQSARLLNMLTGVEILLAAYSATHPNVFGISLNIAEISKFYGYALLLLRLWKITEFIGAMARMETKKPKIISQAEYDQQQHEQEQEQIRMDNASIQAVINQALTQWTNDQARTFANLSAELKASIVLPEMSAPEIDTQAIIQAAIDYLTPHFQARFQAVDQELFRQKTIIAQVETQAKSLPELRQTLNDFQAKLLPEKAATQAPFQAKVQAPNRNTQAEQNVIRLVPANASREDLIAEAKRLRDVVGLSTYAIADKLGKPAKTIQSWLSKGKDQAESEVNEAAN